MKRHYNPGRAGQGSERAERCFHKHNRIGRGERGDQLLDAETPEAAGRKSIFSAGSIIRAAKDQVSCNLAGESAILNIKSGVYYGLDSVGARIWELVQQPRSVNEVRETLLKEYDVEPQRCETDLLALLERLLAEGLIEVQDGPAA